MFIKVILIIFILLILWRIIDRYTRRQIRISELFVWAVFWLVAAGFVLWPDASQRLAEFLGVGRGVDLVVYLALLLAFYLLFKIFVKFEKLEKDITKIVRKIALDDADEIKKEDERYNFNKNKEL